jgi:hypothetical protein
LQADDGCHGKQQALERFHNTRIFGFAQWQTHMKQNAWPPGLPKN